ncbi:MAG: hypothetical protein ABIJ47_05555 [Candidatus Bathyarchaeota archaeon]
MTPSGAPSASSAVGSTLRLLDEKEGAPGRFKEHRHGAPSGV